uniref:Transmembrane protein n=1 Tax=Panagrellus redivivus TaxID=6233 RepID=A0A7E4ZZZ7_PANRE
MPVINNYPYPPSIDECFYEIPAIPDAEKFSPRQYGEICATIKKLKCVIQQLRELSESRYIWDEIRGLLLGESDRLTIELELRKKVRQEQWKLRRNKHIIAWIALTFAIILIGCAIVGAVLRKSYPDTDDMFIRFLQTATPLFGIVGVALSRFTYRCLPS